MPANELRVHNHASTPVTGWVPLVVPRGHGIDDWEYIRGPGGVTGARQARNFDPSRDAVGGDWVYAVHGTWQPGRQSFVLEQAPGGDLRWSFQPHQAYATPTHCSLVTWNPDRWATVEVMGGSWTSVVHTLSLRDQPTREVYAGSRYRVLLRELHAHGFHVSQYLYLFHRERLAAWTLHVNWSDEQAGTSAAPTGTALDKHRAGWTWPQAQQSLPGLQRCVGFVVRFGGSTLVRGKWQANEGWETLAGVRRTASDVGASFRLPLEFASGPNGSSTDWANWQGRWHHGPKFAFRGWMSTNAAELQAANHLQAILSPADWNGHYLLSGVAAVTEPTNPEAIVRPAYSDTTRHWMTWDRGTGGIDSQGGIGLHLDRNTSATSTQGSFGIGGCQQVLHGRQALHDIECGMLDWARRPRWRFRDGGLVLRSDPRCLSTAPGASSSDLGFAMQEGIPHYAGNSTSYNFGRHFDVQNLGIPQTHNDPNRMGQFGEDNQHHSVSTLIAYYQLTLDPAAYELLLDYGTERCLDSRLADWGSDFDMGDHREIGRKLGTIAMVAGVLPAGDALGAYLRSTIGFGGRGVYPNQTFKAAYRRRRFMLNGGRGTARPWQSWPKPVASTGQGNPEFIPTHGVVLFGTDTITRTDAYFTTTATGGSPWTSRIRRRIALEGGSNAGYWYVDQRVHASTSCTVTGGDTITRAAGTWTKTPVVGAWLRIRGGSNPSAGTYAQVASATSSSVTVTGATLTNETANLTLEESTLDVTGPVGVDVDWTGVPLLTAGNVVVSGTSVTPSSGNWVETPATLPNGHGLGYVTIKINASTTYHAKIASATSDTITLESATIPSRSYGHLNAFWNVAATQVPPLNTGTQTGVRAFVIQNQNDNLDTRIVSRGDENLSGAVICPLFDAMGVMGPVACYLLTGDPEWQDWAIQAMEPLLRYAVVTNARGERWLPWILVVDELGRALPGDEQLRNARGAPRSVAPGGMSESAHMVAMGGNALRMWAIGALNWYRQLPAGLGDAQLKARATEMWQTMRPGGNYIGWLHIAFASSIAPL